MSNSTRNILSFSFKNLNNRKKKCLTTEKKSKYNSKLGWRSFRTITNYNNGFNKELVVKLSTHRTGKLRNLRFI